MNEKLPHFENFPAEDCALDDFLVSSADHINSMRKTKIIATLGRLTESPEMLRRMIEAGRTSSG